MPSTTKVAMALAVPAWMRDFNSAFGMDPGQNTELTDVGEYNSGYAGSSTDGEPGGVWPHEAGAPAAKTGFAETEFGGGYNGPVSVGPPPYAPVAPDQPAKTMSSFNTGPAAPAPYPGQHPEQQNLNLNPFIPFECEMDVAGPGQPKHAAFSNTWSVCNISQQEPLRTTAVANPEREEFDPIVADIVGHTSTKPRLKRVQPKAKDPAVRAHKRHQMFTQKKVFKENGVFALVRLYPVISPNTLEDSPTAFSSWMVRLRRRPERVGRAREHFAFIEVPLPGVNNGALIERWARGPIFSKQLNLPPTLVLSSNGRIQLDMHPDTVRADPSPTKFNRFCEHSLEISRAPQTWIADLKTSADEAVTEVRQAVRRGESWQHTRQIESFRCPKAPQGYREERLKFWQNKIAYHIQVVGILNVATARRSLLELASERWNKSVFRETAEDNSSNWKSVVGVQAATLVAYESVYALIGAIWGNYAPLFVLPLVVVFWAIVGAPSYIYTAVRYFSRKGRREVYRAVLFRKREEDTQVENAYVAGLRAYWKAHTGQDALPLGFDSLEGAAARAMPQADFDVEEIEGGAEAKGYWARRHFGKLQKRRAAAAQ